MTDPNNVPLTEMVVVVIGYPTVITVASADNLAGEQRCEFISFVNTNDKSEKIESNLVVVMTWSERLKFKKGKSLKNGKTTWTAEWIAKVNNTMSIIPEETHFVRVSVRKASGKSLIATTNDYRIPGISVTTNPDMLALMRHEFSQESSPWRFDPGPLKKFIKSLTPNQRMKLAKYDENRLVVFISLRGKRSNRPMDAIHRAKGARYEVFSNADFSVFHCKKSGHKILLECHTEYFCVNMANGSVSAVDTPNFIGKIFDRYLQGSKRKPKPPLWDPQPWKLRLTAESHEHCIYLAVVNAHSKYTVNGYKLDEDGNIIINEKTKEKILFPFTIATGEGMGASIMGNNFIHGEINTAGCWMLFRNYNWPISKRNEFWKLFLERWTLYRDDIGGPNAADNRQKIQTKLSELGYDVPQEPLDELWSTSFNKWLCWDRNYAFTFFCRYVLGVKPFKRANGFNPHLHATHGRTKSATTFEKHEKSFEFKKRFALSGYDCYERVRKNPDDPESALDPLPADVGDPWNSENAFGVKTAGGWNKAFADCFIYNPDDLPLKDLRKRPFGPNVPKVTR